MSSRFSGRVRAQRLHLRAALDLEDAGGVGALDRGVGRRVVEGIRERSIRSPRVPGDLSTQRSTADSIPSPSRSILRKPASAQESLSHWTIWRPSIAAGTHRAAVDQRPGRDDHPARVLGDGAAARAPRRPAEPASAQRARPRGALGAERRSTSPADARSASRSRRSPRHPLDLRRRQPERLAELADRAARAVGREGGDQRRALPPVALVDAGDQLRADVAREVEVDVRQRGQLLVEEAAEQRLVRRPGRRARGRSGSRRSSRRSSRGRGRAAAARGRGVRPAHLDRHLTGQLQQLVVEQEEAGAARASRSSAAPPPAGARPRRATARRCRRSGRRSRRRRARRAGAWRPRPRPRDSGSRGRWRGRSSSRSASRRVSATASGCSAKRAAIASGEASTWLRFPRRCGSEASSVVCEADGDERVLQRRAARRGRGRCRWRRREPSRSASRARPRLRARSSRQERPLQLDPEALAAEGLAQAAAEALAAGGVAALPGAGKGTVPGAAGEADEPLGVGLDLLQRRPGRGGGAGGVVAGVGVGGSEQPAEVAIPRRRFDQQRQMHELRILLRSTGRFRHHGCAFRPVDLGRAEGDGQLGAGDRAQRELLAGVGELARSPDAVVVGQRQRRVALGLGGVGQLQRGRGAIEEGEGRVGVQLYVWGRRHRPLRRAGGTSGRARRSGRRRRRGRRRTPARSRRAAAGLAPTSGLRRPTAHGPTRRRLQRPPMARARAAGWRGPPPARARTGGGGGCTARERGQHRPALGHPRAQEIDRQDLQHKSGINSSMYMVCHSF